jgi:hypothetical protein
MFMKKVLIFSVFVLMVQSLACPGKGACTETLMSPEMTIKIYFDAYVAQDWEVVTEYMHPVLLQSLKKRIIDMVQEVSASTRRVLLREYHARSMGELEQMPARQLYVLYLMDRWEGMDAQTEMGIGSSELFFIKTSFIRPDECVVEFKSSVTLENKSQDKIQAFQLKKYQGKWKIYNTDGLKKLNKDIAAERKIL